ncbi:putative nucleotidyltransferase, Ribonuclease H [Helianthus annuus]|nr:putative nucleotidyltransferase, Ribonuclease H [Helianthus annuus]
MTPIIAYLQSGVTPESKSEARKLQHKACHYQMGDGILYRKSYLGPLLRCVNPQDATYLIRDIHEGICGIHAGPRMVVAKIMNAGYYWPDMHLDAVKELRKCIDCQRHAPKTLRPKNNLVPVTTAWPFQKWAIDVVGPFPNAPGAVKFIIVAVDYFTKWVEAKPLASTTAMITRKFIWEHIICRFGLPMCIVTDNGTNFAADEFQKWLEELHIEHIFSSVAHPQGNGQVESINRSLVEGIKARLGTARRGWVDELPSILWAHRTSPKTSNGETPFNPVYGSEVVIPAEVGLPSPRMLAIEKLDNNTERRIDLDLLEERRENAAINEAKYKSKLEKYYNTRVRVCTFNPGDYVLRDNEASNAERPGKLAPKWEGPYLIKEVLGKGAYKLQTSEGEPIARTWNAQQLRRCYM